MGRAPGEVSANQEGELSCPSLGSGLWLCVTRRSQLLKPAQRRLQCMHAAHPTLVLPSPPPLPLAAAAVQRHHFSEKQRFDAQRFQNPQQAVGMAAAPGDTGAGERELPQLPQPAGVPPGRQVRLNAAAVHELSDACCLLFLCLCADAVLSERSAETQEGQTHGALHQSPGTLRHAVRAAYRPALLRLLLRLLCSTLCWLTAEAPSRLTSWPDLEPSTLGVCRGSLAPGSKSTLPSRSRATTLVGWQPASHGYLQ